MRTYKGRWPLARQFEFADLSGARIDGASLEGAVLNGTNLKGAFLFQGRGPL